MNIKAGSKIGVLEKIEESELLYIERTLLSSHKNLKNIFCVKVIGNSMHPEINDNDIIMIEKITNQEYSHADDIYLVVYGGYIHLKQIQFVSEGEILVKSINTSYLPTKLNKNKGVEWEIIGKPIMKFSVNHYSDLHYQP